MNIYHTILENKAAQQKMLAILLDPDKCRSENQDLLCKQINEAAPHFVFVGGSTVTEPINEFVLELKKRLHMPVVLFPGSASQFSPHADALLFLSLISGRNPEYLIGQHVLSAQCIKQSDLETISTGYILISGGKTSAVELASHTTPLARQDVDTAVSTALAGEMLGMKLIYLEAGSGAAQPIPADTIKAVRSALSVPLIVGGGICSASELTAALEAGADLIVVGNHFEQTPDDMKLFCETVRTFANK